MGTVIITGASSGIGRAFALRLAKDNRIILSGRNMQALSELSHIIPNSEIFCADLCDGDACRRLFDLYQDADFVINCAGCGVFGEFCETKLEDELKMLDINITAVFVLTKLYVNEFIKRGSGAVLNVSSSAAFFTGPLFSSYYASKAYVYRLTTAVHDELKKQKSHIKVSVLCPGPVNTDFNERAGVCAGRGAVTPEFVVDESLKNLGKRVIIPGFVTKLMVLCSKFLPEYLLSSINYRLQRKKQLDFRNKRH